MAHRRTGLVTSAIVSAFLLAACGEVQSSLPDSGGSDAPVGDAVIAADGAAPDAPGPLPVHVRVNMLNYSGDPDLGAIVVFTNPDGTVIFDGLVDGAGEASAMLEPGGMVTVLRVTVNGVNRFARLMTVTDVQPGDDLLFGYLPISFANGAQVGTMPTTYTPWGGSGTHAFYTDCDQISAPAGGGPSLRFYENCQPETFDLLVVATGVTPPRFVAMKDISYSSGTTVAVPNSYQIMPNFALTFTNVPAEITYLGATRTTWLGQRPKYSSWASMGGDPPAGLNSMALSYPPGVGDLANVLSTIYRSGSPGIQMIETQTTTVAGSMGIDMGVGELPWITSEPVLTSGGVTWTETGTGTPDVRYVRFEASWPFGGGNHYTTWMVASAAGGTAMSIPALPAQYDEFNPANQASLQNPYANVVYMDYDVLDGYAETRGRAETLWNYEQLSDTGAFAGMNVTRRSSLSFEF